ncbi:MAG: flagellar export chaperone FlgN [bacterium]|nr:flagellar export chaperone FlgN [bacterium]
MVENNNHNGLTLLEFLDGLNNYLVELTETNRDLLSVLKKYQKILVQCDTKTIEKATPGLDRLAGQIRMIDEKRRQYVDSYFSSRGWDGPRNFSALADRIKNTGVTDEQAAAFDRTASSRMDLIEILAEVDAQNSLNITLIGQGLSFAEVSLKALLGFENDKSSYGPSNDPDNGPSFLDAQA